MRFKLALLAVQDVERSKRFYRELFDQEVRLDLGWNVTFSGGFAIQQNFAWLTGVPEGEICYRANNAELYFEVEDFDSFVEKLAALGGVKLLHPPRMHEWKQRVVRLYDPDGHLIEVGEAMGTIARRYLAEGMSPEAVAKAIQHPLEFVLAARDNREEEF